MQETNLIITIDIGDIIAFIACIISVICAVFTFWQVRIAKKEYALQKKIYLDGLSKLELNIRKCFIYNDKNEDNIYLFFGLIISNLSDKQTSIKKCVLSLSCEDNIIYKPSLCETPLPLYNELDYLSIPINMEAHSSCGGWTIFKLSRDVYQKIDINMFTICVEDIHGAKVVDSTILIGEEISNYEINKKH